MKICNGFPLLSMQNTLGIALIGNGSRSFGVCNTHTHTHRIWSGNKIIRNVLFIYSDRSNDHFETQLLFEMTGRKMKTPLSISTSIHRLPWVTTELPSSTWTEHRNASNSNSNDNADLYWCAPCVSLSMKSIWDPMHQIQQCVSLSFSIFESILSICCASMCASLVFGCTRCAVEALMIQTEKNGNGKRVKRE